MAKTETPGTETTPPLFQVAPSPHFSNTGFTTRRMMIDVLLGLLPAIAVSIYVFGWFAVTQIGLCVLACLGAEAVFTKMRGRTIHLQDGSAIVTGLLLGMSLPALAPPYIAVIGSVVAIGLGKIVFGGLGYNLFNPAMVGRAFVMLSFAAQMGAPAYVISMDASATVGQAESVPTVLPQAPTVLTQAPTVLTQAPTVLTQATPLNVAKQYANDVAKGKVDARERPQSLEDASALRPLFLGTVNGSLGETSALALLLGGLYLCIRRTASWEIPVGVLAATLVLAQFAYWAGLTPLDGLRHVLSGAALLGAFFIATDPVSSPLTGKGKLVFGVGVGVVLVMIRVLSGYSEGLMFAVLLMNAVVPLINRWTVPTPFGGPVPEPPQPA